MSGRETARALALGLVHALVDGAGAFVLFRDVSSPATPLVVVIAWIVGYDALAFLLQAPIGLLVDRWGRERALALAGLALVLAALGVSPVGPGGGAILAALGNALFHVGAGAVVLRGSAGAAAIGLFVGPGATGLGLGIVLGRGGTPARPALVMALLLGGVLVARLLPKAAAGRVETAGTTTGRAGLARPVLVGCGLLLLTVGARSLVGDTVTSVWRAQPAAVLLGLALLASGGKMLGGVVADRAGWIPTAGMALAAAGPLLALGLGDFRSAGVGILLVQSTMPLTLKALHHALPERPGFAFGLASAVLVLGAAPGLLSLWILRSFPLVLAATWTSAAAVVAGLALVARLPAPPAPAAG